MEINVGDVVEIAGFKNIRFEGVVNRVYAEEKKVRVYFENNGFDNFERYVDLEDIKIKGGNHEDV